MVNSLRGRLTGLMFLLLAATGSLAFFFTSYAIDEVFFDRYFAAQEILRNERLMDAQSRLPVILTAYYERNPDRANLESIFQDLAWLRPEGILLTTPDSSALGRGTTLQAIGDLDVSCETTLPISSNGRVIFQICFKANDLRDKAQEEAFTNQVRKSLVLAFLIASALSLLLILSFTRPILRPLEALTQAVNAIERGEMPKRVDSSSIREILDLTNAFNSMSTALKQAETLRKNMVSDIAHELRTPLANICGYLEALDDGVIEPSAETLRSLHDESQLLHHLVDDLQDLALADAGRLKIHYEPVDLRELITSSIKLIDLPISTKKIKLTVEVEERLPQVSVDRERTGQILRNLITNAVEHTPFGGRVKVSARANADNVHVQITNSGDAIAPEHLPLLFERFYRIDESRTRMTGGCGLGLAIVKQLVEAQGGTVGVTSENGHGTSFFFTVPIAKSTA